MTAQLDFLAPPVVNPDLPIAEALTAAVLARGSGITLQQLGTVDALSRELQKREPDETHLHWMAQRLGLSPTDLPREGR